MVDLINKGYFLMLPLIILLIIGMIYYIQHILRYRISYEKNSYIGEKKRNIRKK